MFGELDDSDIYENNSQDGFNNQQGNDSDLTGGFSYNDNAEPSQESDFLNTDESQDDMYGQSSFMAGKEIYGTSQDQSQDGLLGSQPETTSAYEQQEIPQQQTQSGTKKKMNPALLYILLLGVLFVAAVGMFFYKKSTAPVSEVPSNDQAMGDYFYDKAAANNPTTTGQGDSATATVDVDLGQGQPGVSKNPTDKAQIVGDEPINALDRAMMKKKADEAKTNQIGLNSRAVIIPVSAGGRVDPFVPLGQAGPHKVYSKFDLIPPPTEIPAADPVVDEIVQTKISGIMYDGARPSAIINIGGNDQLVHKGDMVNGYKVLNITKKSVVIKYKTNIYQAAVGQSLSEGINLNPVSNLSRQFGGAYSRVPGSTIQFNK